VTVQSSYQAVSLCKLYTEQFSKITQYFVSFACNTCSRAALGGLEREPRTTPGKKHTQKPQKSEKMWMQTSVAGRKRDGYLLVGRAAAKTARVPMPQIGASKPARFASNKHATIQLLRNTHARATRFSFRKFCCHDTQYRTFPAVKFPQTHGILYFVKFTSTIC
jgi:hypothetical protein